MWPVWFLSCGCRRGGGGVVRGFVSWWCGGWSTFPALLCALVDLNLFWYILLSVNMSGESWYTTRIFKPQSQFSNWAC